MWAALKSRTDPRVRRVMAIDCTRNSARGGRALEHAACPLEPAARQARPRKDEQSSGRAYFFAARLPAAMITKITKAINAHQATLSVSCCHFRTSHMS